MAIALEEKRRLPLLTVSEVRSSRACARQHHYRYDLGFRPVKNAPTLAFGTLFHAGLEAWWLARQRIAWTPECQPGDADGVDVLQAALDAIAEHARKVETDTIERIRAEELMIGYHARWYVEPLEVLGVETVFRTELRNPETGAASRTYELAGKLDAIVRCLRTGRVLIVEHKTSGEDITLGGEYWSRLRLDAQVSTYYVGARALGHEPAGMLYDVIGKVRLEQLKATPIESRKYKKGTNELYANQRAEDESLDDYRERVRADIAERPDRYFARGEVVRLEEEEREAAFDTWQTAALIREGRRLERFPRNPDACVRYGRTCDYFPVCTGEAALTDVHRYQHVGDVHEELKS